MLVTPGFIDLHTHYDAQLFWIQRQPVTAAGVTTALVGNSAFSLAPCGPGDAVYLSGG